MSRNKRKAGYTYFLSTFFFCNAEKNCSEIQMMRSFVVWKAAEGKFSFLEQFFTMVLFIVPHVLPSLHMPSGKLNSEYFVSEL